MRNHPSALEWIQTQSDLAITPIVWMEVMQGVPGKSGQARSKKLLDRFELAYLIPEDQAWAMQQLINFRLSHDVAMSDCMVASVCHRLDVPLYTHNIKDMRPILPAKLIIRPFDA